MRSYAVCRYSSRVQTNFGNMLANIGQLIQQAPSCEDTATFCAQIASSCPSANQWLKDQCKRTCGVC